MQIDVKIDQDAVQQQVVQAILDSAIGANLQKYISEALTKVGNWQDGRNLVQRAVDDAVAGEIRHLATELIQSKRNEIRAQMIEKLTDEVIGKMITAAWEVMEGKLRARD